MSNLLASLMASAGALRAFEQGLDVTQNNVSNVSTPGYARQRLALQAAAFEPLGGLPGGVTAAAIQSARDGYADQEVRRQVQELGYFIQKSSSLAGLEASFDVSGQNGLAGALSRLFQEFSAWSVAPNSTAARQAVLEGARTVADSFRRAAGDLADASVRAERELQQTVQQINGLAARLRDYNLERLRIGHDDPGLDARVHAVLEELSELGDFTALQQADGTTAVFLGGQTLLVTGGTAREIRIGVGQPAAPPPLFPDAPPSVYVRDQDGVDVTAQLRGGRLGALLEFRNQSVPALLGDAVHAGELNRLAKAVADRVNGLLTSGLVQDSPPAPGVPLFSYGPGDDTAVARTLALNPAVTPDQLAAIDPGPPFSANGIARRLAALASPESAADKLDGFSYIEFYGNQAARLGGDLRAANDSRDLQKQLVAQARSLRDQISGVSLDEEAVHVIELQRAYQAAARMVSVLSDLTEVAVNLLR